MEERYNFSLTYEDGHSTDLSFVTTDATIYEFHRMCKSFAKALGYSTRLIEETFGEDCDL